MCGHSADPSVQLNKTAVLRWCTVSTAAHIISLIRSARGSEWFSVKGPSTFDAHVKLLQAPLGASSLLWTTLRDDNDDRAWSHSGVTHGREESKRAKYDATTHLSCADVQPSMKFKSCRYQYRLPVKSEVKINNMSSISSMLAMLSSICCPQANKDINKTAHYHQKNHMEATQKQKWLHSLWTLQGQQQQQSQHASEFQGH